MQDQLEAFLAHILPEEGLRCIVVLGGARPVQRFFKTNSEAAAFALEQDALGLAVYHACATYKDNTSRKSRNVKSVKSLWLDVDCGEGKPYSKRVEGLRALATLRLPTPTVIASGRAGFHCYWVLPDPVDSGAWRRLARVLKTRCVQQNVYADHARTTDVASILRPVGTHNRKHDEEVQVAWTGPQGAHEPGLFEVLAPPAGEERLEHLPDFTRKADDLQQETPSDPGEIAGKCAQMRAVRDAAGAEVPEPLWRAALGVLAYCGDDYAAAHMWSASDPRYTAGETQSKIDRWRANAAGPARCEHFQAINPEGCASCPFAGRISSPIELGRPPYVSIRGEPLPVSEADINPTLPEGFAVDSSGLYLVTAGKKEGEFGRLCVSLTPFWLRSVGRALGEEDGVHYTLAVRAPKEPPRDMLVGAGHVTGHGASAYMAARGVRIVDMRAFQTYLHEAVKMIENQQAMDVHYKQYGWKKGNDEEAFVIGPRLYRRDGVFKLPLIGDARDRARHFELRGSLDEWTANADMLCAPGCEAQQFAILASAAAPLMKFHNCDEGGAIYSLTSIQSSTGKSTAFDAAYTFWGDRGGIAFGSTSTENSRAITLATNCNIPVLLDEATLRDAEELQRFCRTFTDGQGRARATVDGRLQQNPLTWQTVMLCGSNTPMLETLGSIPGSQAMQYRILEVIPSLPPGLSSVGEELRRGLKLNSGQAGHRYLQWLTQNAAVRRYIDQKLPEFYKEVEELGLERPARFLIRLISAARVAGEILKTSKILCCNPARMMEWGVEQAKQQLKYVADGIRGDDPLTRYMAEFPADFVTVAGAGRQAGTMLNKPARAVRGRYERASGLLFVSQPMFRQWLAGKNYSFREVKKALEEDGRLTGVKLVTLTAGTELPGGQVQCFVIRDEKAGLDFDEAEGGNVVRLKQNSAAGRPQSQPQPAGL